MEEKAQLPAEGRDPASDEEIARRLQQQLNGEAAAAARRRTRKQPTFYSPQVGSACPISLHTHGFTAQTPDSAEPGLAKGLSHLPAGSCALCMMLIIAGLTRLLFGVTPHSLPVPAPAASWRLQRVPRR